MNTSEISTADSADWLDRPPARQFRPGEPLGTALRQSLYGEHAHLARLLYQFPAAPEAAVHRARQSLKRMRALLRLCDPVHGGHWRRQDRDYREIGRLLSSSRDRHVLMQTLRALAPASGSPPGGAPKQSTDRWHAAAQALAASLHQQASAPTVSVARLKKVFARCQQRLPDLLADCPQWPDARIHDNYLDGYRDARKRWRRARRKPSPANLHRWRQSVQRHLNQTELLQTLAPEVLGPRLQPLRKLAAHLGKHQDLEVFDSYLRAHEPGLKPRKRFRRLAARGRKSQRRIEHKALRAGKRMFRQKPRAFRKALALSPADTAPLPVEIERKFVLDHAAWQALKPTLGAPEEIEQGYLGQGTAVELRVRLRSGEGSLTIKSAGAAPSRIELEYSIPAADARLLLENFCRKPLIAKQRYVARHDGMTWSIDEFTGDNAGLVLAEVELRHAQQPLRLPSWAAREVTHDHRYYNAYLSEVPYRHWH